MIKNIPKKKKRRRQNGSLRRLYKQLRKEEKLKAMDKMKDHLFECRVPKNSKERFKKKKPSSVVNVKK